jgi:hypothetical protein
MQVGAEKCLPPGPTKTLSGPSSGCQDPSSPGLTVDDYRDQGVGGQKLRTQGASRRRRPGAIRGSATFVIRGQPGVGKTDLLDELETLPHDFRVIRTDGIESELQLDYAMRSRIHLAEAIPDTAETR